MARLGRGNWQEDEAVPTSRMMLRPHNRAGIESGRRLMLDHYIKHEQCVQGYVRLSAASRADMTAKVENLDEHGRCHSLPQYAIIGQQPEFSGAFHMSTTVHLTDDELADLKELTKQTDPAAAVRAAMHDYVRYAADDCCETVVRPHTDTEQLAGFRSLRDGITS